MKTQMKKDRIYVEKNIWNKIKKTIGKVPFIPDVVALYFSAMDKNTPLKARATAFGALAYFILPLDLIPDALPGGFVDDAAAIAAAIKVLEPYITKEHREKSRKWLGQEEII